MAVYTEVSAEALAVFLDRYDVGSLLSAKGIAEGVSNSNFLVETTRARFVLTLYERRIDLGDLPFFIALMQHLAAAGLPVPRPVADRTGNALQTLEGRAACLIQYFPGVSVSHPTPAQCFAVAAELARLHLAGRDFTPVRPNSMGPDWWQQAGTELLPGLDTIEPGLAALVDRALLRLDREWPRDLPSGIIHADLFPDNVLMLGEQVTGLIDFYFACTDLLAYDFAVLHAAWAFAPDGSAPSPLHEAALMQGYASIRPLSVAERAALPLLGTGAAMRFLLSRGQDWLAGESGALVQRKDPLPFARRLAYHAGR